MHVEDHPVEYGGFEGTIPKGEYGGGTVMLWDTGTWEPAGDPREGLEKGELEFRVEGERLRGTWVLVHTGGRRGRATTSGCSSRSVTRRPRRRAGTVGRGRPQRHHRPQHGRDRRRRGAAPSGARAAAGAAPRPQTRRPCRTPCRSPWRRSSRARPGRRLGPRDQVRRLPHRGARRWRGRAPLLPQRARLDGAVPQVAAALRSLPASGTWLDGEVVVFDERGVSDFGRLQRHLKDGRAGDLTYVVFDLLFQDGEDLRELPLSERKRRLRWLLGRGGKPLREVVRYGDHIDGQGDAVYEEACLQELEGVVSKRAGDRYAGRRTRSWLKSKCARSQEFVVGGFTEPAARGRASAPSSWACTTRRARCATPAASVPASTTRALARLRERLAALEQDAAPFADPPRGAQARGVHWTAPELVAEVRFSEWTGDGRLRHPVFQGLREDKGAAEVRREGGAGEPPALGAAPGPEGRAPDPSGRPSLRRPRRRPAGAIPRKPVVGGVAISHPDRLVFPDPGLTKLDVAEYYSAVAGPHGPVPRAPRPHGDPLPRRDRRGVLLPEARDAVRPQDRRQGPRARQSRGRDRLPRGGHCRGPPGHGAERRRGVPRVGLPDRGDRDAGHPGVRPRPGARPGLAQGARGRAGAARRT